MGLFNKLFKKSKQTTIVDFDNNITSSFNIPEKMFIAEGCPPFKLSNEQKTVIFLDWCNKTKSSVKRNSEYPQWHTYKLKISPSNFHKQLIENDYLIQCTPDIALNKLKVAELKEILHSNNIEAKGKKADLVSAIISTIDIQSLNLQKYYHPSEKGIELLERIESKELLIAFNNRYGISLEEFYYIKEKCHNKSSPNDILWQTLNEKQLLDTKNKNYGWARNVCLNQAYLLEDEKRYLPALEHYIKTIYYDLSGCGNSNSIHDKEQSKIAPAIIGYIQNLSEYYTDEIIERCKRIYLPHHHYNIEDFEKIINSIIQETDYYTKFVF